MSKKATAISINKNRMPIGEALIAEGLINNKQLADALKHQEAHGGRLGSVLLSLGYIKQEQLVQFLERFYEVPSIDLNSFEVDPAVLKILNQEICEKYVIMPLSKAGNTLVVAFADPGNIMIVDDLGFLTRSKIQVVVAPEAQIQSAIKRYFGSSRLEAAFGNKEMEGEYVTEVEINQPETIDDKSDLEKDSPIVRFVNIMLTEAINKNASDIHVEPYEKRFRIRFRIDGNLIETIDPPPGTAAAIASRIKIMCQMDIAEKRRPQDGRLKVRTPQGKTIDFRVNSIPTLFGEKIVMRILDKSNLKLDMTQLGFEPDDLKLFKECIALPTGLVLLTGPTGSGKTTTIYSALAELNQPDVNICTAEDPVEFNLEGINQVQMNSDIDVTFASALRAFLRQDPDIIMVGEIRDYETAEIAFKAAATGHMVVSTLHTNDAPATISRLIDMGVAPYIVTSTITLIVAQRLVGKICESCKEPIYVPPEVLIDLGVEENDLQNYRIFKARGCAMCNNTGIKGRLAIYELMRISEPIKQAILEGASTSTIRKLARQEGMRTLRRSALLKLKRGETTIEYVASSSVKDV